MRVSQKSRLQKFHSDTELANKENAEVHLNRQIGIIDSVDPLEEGLAQITAAVPRRGGGYRLWGGGRVINIINGPEDILQRFGEIRPGLVVELFWRGKTEQTTCAARVIGIESEELAQLRKKPDSIIPSTPSSVFEPTGLF